MGNNSQKSITDAESKPKRGGQCSCGNNPEQRPLASVGAEEEEGEGMGSQYQTVETYHKGWQRGFRLGYKQQRDFYEAKITVLEKQVEHWKEIASR